MKRFVLAVMAAVFAAPTFLGAQNAAAAEKVQFVVYNSYAPLIIDETARKGLAYSVAEVLTARSQGKYQFTVEILPRKRLDDQLATSAIVAVPFVAPQFFGDKDMTKYGWTSPMFSDRQEVVTNPSHPIEYSGPDSLTGKTIGGINGHRYLPLEDAVKAGKIIRQDVASDEQNLAKLAAARIDAISISALSFNYLKDADPRFSALTASKMPLYPIERRVLVQGSRELRDYIEAQFHDIPTAADWKAAFTNFGVK